jgi:hypothetical protein
MPEPAACIRRRDCCQCVPDGRFEGLAGAQQGLELDQQGSMGRRSGDYGAQQISRAPRSSMRSWMPATVCPFWRREINSGNIRGTIVWRECWDP